MMGDSQPPEVSWWDDGGSMLDQIICACGWKSATYFDGREYAYAEWQRHKKSCSGLQSSKKS